MAIRRLAVGVGALLLVVSAATVAPASGEPAAPGATTEPAPTSDTTGLPLTPPDTGSAAPAPAGPTKDAPPPPATVEAPDPGTPDGPALDAVDPSPPEHTGLGDGHLRDLAATAQQAGTEALVAPVTVEIGPAATDAEVEALVTGAGGQVTGSVPGELVQADVPVGALEGIEADPAVAFVRTPVEAIPPPDTDLSIPVTGEEIRKINADDWHVAGFTGTGVKVGIIDAFDFEQWAAAYAQDELPVPAGAFCKVGGQNCSIWDANGTHGEGVAEIIHEVAPSAQLYLATVATASDYQAAVDWFHSQGVQIISQSQTARYDGSGAGDGPLATVMNNAVADGMLWVQSAGNSAGDPGTPFSGQYWRGTWSDPDNDGYLSFSGSDETLKVRCALINGVRWSDWYEAGITDFDVDLFRVNGDGSVGAKIASFANDQATTGQPVEYPSWNCNADPWAYLTVRLYASGSGHAGDVIEIMGNLSAFEHFQNPFSATGPFADSASPGAITVGAIDPPMGTALATYSSQGPTNDSRLKPDLSAPACVQSYTYGAFQSRCFNGTSAATPVVAGAAALVRGWGGNSGEYTTPTGVKSYLDAFAVDRGTAGDDYLYGKGEVRLPSPTGSPPANDAFAAATSTTLGSGGSVSGTNLNATAEASEPSHAGTAPARTVWYKFTAPETGTLTLDTYQSTFDTVLAVYTGSAIGGLSTVGSNDDALPNDPANPINRWSRVTVGVTAGMTYRVAVGGYTTSETGKVVLTSVFQPATPSAGFVDVTPFRLLDSRGATGGWNGAPLGPGQTRSVQVTGAGGIPAGATAVVMNVTATSGTAASYLTASPAGTATPLAANLLFAAGQTVPNLVTVKIGTGGAVSLFNASGSVHVIADVVGYFQPGTGTGFAAVTPFRALDSRATTGGWSSTPLGPNQVRDLAVGGVAGVPANATGVVMNVTVTGGTAPSYLQVFPSGAVQPVTANLLFGTGQTVPNLVTSGIGANGRVSFYNQQGAVHVVADVVGYYGPSVAGGRFHPINPTRILDDRDNVGGSIEFWRGDESRAVAMANVAGVPANASAVVANVTATNGGLPSFLALYPTGAAKPDTANVVWGPGQTIPNLVTVKTGTSGQVQIYNQQGGVDVIADLAGYYEP